ncbi:universal stress protein [Phytomonospora sp. NPDC050363]|uniref:universal stress protein n=1 Tax=Phytomonospora sp. NPDC050363 TaxID=3155642 RepID=UPI0033D292B4
MRTQSMGRAVVVGIDESAHSVAALRWAAREAETSGSPLVIVHAYEWELPTRMLEGGYYFPLRDAGVEEVSQSDFERFARELVANANDVVTETSAHLSVMTRIVEGPAVDVLNAEAKDASMLVLGSHGRGLLGRMLLGSVSSAIAAEPPCPIVVVRSEAAPAHVGRHLPVVVGVDGTPVSSAAAAYAAAHAARQGSPLRIVHVHREAANGGNVESEWLRELVLSVEKQYPGLEAAGSLISGRPVQALVELSSESELVVVGAQRGRGGSVARGLLHHAWSSVAVVPQHSWSTPAAKSNSERKRPSRPVRARLDGTGND